MANLSLKSIIITLMTLMSLSSQAFIDSFPSDMDFNIEEYELTEKQVEVLQSFIDKGKPNGFLMRMAKALVEHNEKQEVFIPEHSFEALTELQEWARGKVFGTFAQKAGVEFNNEAYQNDCPNRALFNFGVANGTEYFHIDVVLMANNLDQNMLFMYSTDESTNKSNFKKDYLEMAESMGFMKYIKVL